MVNDEKQKILKIGYYEYGITMTRKRIELALSTTIDAQVKGNLTAALPAIYYASHSQRLVVHDRFDIFTVEAMGLVTGATAYCNGVRNPYWNYGHDGSTRVVVSFRNAHQSVVQDRF